MKKKNKKDEFSPKVARSIALAELFLERLKKKQIIPLRTLRLMELRLAMVHRLIKPLRKKGLNQSALPIGRPNDSNRSRGSGSATRLDSDIDSALLEIERAKVRREWYLKTKKKARTFGNSALNRKK
ncbi:MAG: hypothetical protein Q7R73_00500 [bacterium]|nr:hypothetical protein [bacterium]